jgi:hypothetical protein
MPTYKRFSGDVPILVEIEGEGEVKPGGGLSDALEVVGAVASSSINVIRKLSGEQQPQEIEISFGLRAIADQSSLTVVLGEEKINFRVKLKWGGMSIGEVVSKVVS